jgi:hypothetical protein
VFLDEKICEGFMIASTSNSHRALAFVMLKYVMAHFVQENLSKHELPKGVAWPIDKCGAHSRQVCDNSAGALKLTEDRALQEPGNAPWWKGLLE